MATERSIEERCSSEWRAEHSGYEILAPRFVSGSRIVTVDGEVMLEGLRPTDADKIALYHNIGWGFPERAREHSLAEAAKRLRGSIGFAYISEQAVFRFIREYDNA